MADHLVAGKPTERKGGTGRQIGDGTEPSLEGLGSERLPAEPGASHRVLPLLFTSPMLRLHLDAVRACEDEPSCMGKGTREARGIGRGKGISIIYQRAAWFDSNPTTEEGETNSCTFSEAFY